MIKRKSLTLEPECLFKLPVDASVIDFAAGRQGEYIDMWYDDPGQSEGKEVAYVIKIRGTGQNSPKGALHLKTIVMPSGLVWHLYITGQTNVG